MSAKPKTHVRLVVLLIVLALVGVLFWDFVTHTWYHREHRDPARYVKGAAAVDGLGERLKQFREEHGAFPNELGELATTSMDLENPFSGSNFVYRVAEETASILFTGKDDALGGQGWDADIEILVFRDHEQWRVIRAEQD